MNNIVQPDPYLINIEKGVMGIGEQVEKFSYTGGQVNKWQGRADDTRVRGATNWECEQWLV